MNEAIDVARYLTTHHSSKKHGGYDIYEDDKIKISYDTYFPNVSISIKDGEKLIPVYSRSGHGSIGLNKPGKWVDYIKALAEKAAKIKNEREEAATIRRRQEHEKHFGAINDSHIFG